MRFQQRVFQLKKVEIIFESQLNDVFNRARLIEKKMNQVIEIKLHLQKELINAHAFLATRNHLNLNFFRSFSRNQSSKQT